MQQINVRPARDEEIEQVIPILLQAEPSEPALRWSLEHLTDVVYVAQRDSEYVGAATVRWRDDPAEIVELAIAETEQRRGLGRQLVEWIVEEARRRGIHHLEVGTSNASVGNIRFYQRCGFRMDRVRRDYFWYYRIPIFEEGIPVRDLLVFNMNLDGQDTASTDVKSKRGA